MSRPARDRRRLETTFRVSLIPKVHGVVKVLLVAAVLSGRLWADA